MKSTGRQADCRFLVSEYEVTLELQIMPCKMQDPMKTGVLVHGCNLNIENWRHVAWGDPPDQPGRIPQGILVAAQCGAELIVFGTGASKKKFQLGDSDKTGVELTEAEYALEYLRIYFDKLSRFDALRQRIPELNDPDQIVRFAEKILSRITLDVTSMNTAAEIRNAGEVFAANRIEEVYLVSSPSHIVRCLRDAGEIYYADEHFAGFRHHLRAVPSTTCYEGTHAGDVVVVEPPHRPDRHVVPTYRRIQRMLALQKLGHEDLVKLIEEFDDLLQKYENRIFNQ